MDTILLLESKALALTQSLSAHDYDGATAALDVLYRDILQSINEAQYQKYFSAKQFDKALSYAAKIINLVPEKHIGYLYAGHCLSAQSKLRQAITMYKRGFALSDNDQTLKALVEKTRQRLDRAVTDWIHLLPYDVNSIIFTYLTFKERCICLDVCSPWRIQLSHYTSLWRNVEFNSSDQRTLLCVGTHVTGVAFTRMSAEKLVPVLQTLIDRDCTNIKSFKLLECDISTDQLVYYMAQMCHNTLELEIHGHEQRLLLQPLLDSCPNITRLFIKQSNGQHSRNDDLEVIRPTGVTHLYLHHDKPIDHMLSHSALLTSIVLEKRKQMDIQQCVALCPKLQYFQHNNGLSPVKFDKSIAELGLRHLGIGKSVIDDHGRACVKQVIQQNRRSLISLKIEAQQGDRRNWSSVFDGILPDRLETLDLSAELENTLIPLLQHSKETLTSITFQAMLCVQDHIIDTVLSLPRLNTLCILDCINLTEVGMLQLVSGISVTHLEMKGYSFYLTDAVLEALARNTRIKVLKLSWCGLGPAHRMQAFVESLISSHSAVEELSFTRASIHADTLHALGDLPRLKQLTLSMCTNVTNYGVKQLVEKQKQPFVLVISECNLLSPEIIQSAADKLGNGFQYMKG